MNNILEDVLELKELILETDEYKNYKSSLNKIESNNKVNTLIKDIVSKQKEITNKEYKKVDTSLLEQELDSLYEELNNIKEYSDYIENSILLNNLITNIQNRFEEYFNSLVS
ncbi:MAG: YlbF family regulator [Bacilli bacterium]|nr:YlbF family regulator [Bacilli bacterium]